MNCPICQREVPDDEPQWSDGNHLCCLICVDALAVAVLNAGDSKNRYARTIVETLFQSARQVLVREGAIS